MPLGESFSKRNRYAGTGKESTVYEDAPEALSHHQPEEQWPNACFLVSTTKTLATFVRTSYETTA